MPSDTSAKTNPINENDFRIILADQFRSTRAVHSSKSINPLFNVMRLMLRTNVYPSSAKEINGRRNWRKSFIQNYSKELIIK